MPDSLTLTDLPNAPLDLSGRLRDIRTRQGLKQSEVARRMGLDPSIPSLWEQGKRPVPANRLQQLAEALGVAVSELIEGVPATAARTAPRPPAPTPPPVPTFPQRAYREPVAPARPPLVTMTSPPATPFREVNADEEAAPDGETVETVSPPRKSWEAQPRPELDGWIPDGWEPSDRIQDIGPSLPDGYWLDPVKLERSAARTLLRARLCEADRKLLGEKDVPGLAMAERIYHHCAREQEFNSIKLPLVEGIFRLVLASEYGGLSVDALIEALQNRSIAATTNRALLRRLRDSFRGYPIRWVDREFFGL